MSEIVVLSQLYVKADLSQSRRVDLDAGPRRSLDGANRDDQKPDGSSRTGSPDLSEGVDSKIDTMWFGSQHGIIYVYHIPGPSTRAQKEIGRVRLSDSVVSLINNQSKCIIACLANGTIALIKSRNSLWDFSTSAIKIIDFGAPHHAIGCSILVEKNSQLWCGYRNEIKIVDVEKEMKIVKTITAHPRRESRIRIMTQNGLGIWVSIRLDSTLRLYHAISGEHLQDIDVEPFVSKMFGKDLYDKPSFSFVRITSLKATSRRLWIGTGHGIIISIPYKGRDVILDEKGRGGKVAIVTDELLPYCSIEDAQLSLHGFREAVKFFIEFEKENLSKIAAGGVGYIDFRTANANTLTDKNSMSSKSHLILWQN